MAALMQAQCAARVTAPSASASAGRVTLKGSAFTGKAVVAHSGSVSLRSSPGSRGAALMVRAADAATPAPAAVVAKPVKEEPKEFVAPPLNPNTPSPIFGGSTGGLLRKAQVEEFYVLTWTAAKEMIFEMPTGGAAIMRKGPNLLKLARKEQCLALLNSMRSKNKIDGCVYRVFPSGEVQYLHPKDGVYPEKVNKGRTQSNTNMRSIGKNPNPATIKFGGKLTNGYASNGDGFSRTYDQ
eukprot:CAMPEP_0197575910 /NCGR_PEP_ID=MMETSP1326-20131121/1123_1 /TAXON_ID=1155430 /ORGANISM="Genus nov. species nov., Strain RCC2288" /LENGTH=238 /DNA_ID=CAMNT_0043138739 /DNA_START=81 /DNA_END=797 /DNA_ORIENTATION=-